MPNSHTPHSRALRAATARRRTVETVAAGGRRLTVLLQPADAARLERLEQVYGTATAVVVAGMAALGTSIFPANETIRCKQRKKNERRKEMRSFIISDGRPVAILAVQFPAGPCRFGRERCTEALDANREWNLVNGRDGTISSAAKWQDWERKNNVELPFASELNRGEFLII